MKIVAAIALSFSAAAGCGSSDATPENSAPSPDDEVIAHTEQGLHRSPLGRSLPGAYSDAARVYPRFELRADQSYDLDTGIRCVRAPCPSGESGAWNLYRFGGAYYVALVASARPFSFKWLRVNPTAGQPNELVGVYGVVGDFLQQPAPYVCPEAGTIDCMPLVPPERAAVCSGPFHAWVVGQCPDVAFVY